MSEETQEPTTETPDELTLLKERAKHMGIPFPKTIKLETLKKKVETALNDTPAEPEPEAAPKKTSKQAQFAKARKEAWLLTRCQVVCNDPNKREWDGEMFSVSNQAIGVVKKFIPYNSVITHIPAALLGMLKEKKCQVFFTTKDSRGRKVRRGKQINQFSITELDPISQEELQAIAARQNAQADLDAS